MSIYNKRIALIRKKNSLTQHQVAEFLNLKESTYSQMERSGKISCEVLISLSKLFKIDVKEILFGEECSAPPIESVSFELTETEKNHIIALRNISLKKRNKIIEITYKVFKTKRKRSSE